MPLCIYKDQTRPTLQPSSLDTPPELVFLHILLTVHSNQSTKNDGISWSMSVTATALQSLPLKILLGYLLNGDDNNVALERNTGARRAFSDNSSTLFDSIYLDS